MFFLLNQFKPLLVTRPLASLSFFPSLFGSYRSSGFCPFRQFKSILLEFYHILTFLVMLWEFSSICKQHQWGFPNWPCLSWCFYVYLLSELLIYQKRIRSGPSKYNLHALYVKSLHSYYSLDATEYRFFPHLSIERSQ